MNIYLQQWQGGGLAIAFPHEKFREATVVQRPALSRDRKKVLLQDFSEVVVENYKQKGQDGYEADTHCVLETPSEIRSILAGHPSAFMEKMAREETARALRAAIEHRYDAVCDAHALSTLNHNQARHKSDVMAAEVEYGLARTSAVRSRFSWRQKAGDLIAAVIGDGACLRKLCGERTPAFASNEILQAARQRVDVTARQIKDGLHVMHEADQAYWDAIDPSNFAAAADRAYREKIEQWRERIAIFNRNASPVAQHAHVPAPEAGRPVLELAFSPSGL